MLFCSCVFCISSLNVFAISLGVISSSIPKLLRHLMCSQKMRTGDDACDARPRLISSRTMRPGDGMKHCLVRKQEPSEFNSTGRKTLGIPASSLQASQRIHAYQPGGRVPKTSTLNEFRFLHLNDFSPCVCVLILIDSTYYNYRGMIRMLSFVLGKQSHQIPWQPPANPPEWTSHRSPEWARRVPRRSWDAARCRWSNCCLSFASDFQRTLAA